MDARPDSTLHGDTSRESLRAQIAALRRMSARERLAMMDDLTGFVRTLTREGLRRRHPGISGTELDARFSQLVLGEELAARVSAHRRARSASSSS